jgi:twitching motility protein PilT
MSAVDSLLSLAHREGATELRLGTDRAPAMFGTAKRLSIPKTPNDMLRHLLGELLSPDVEAKLREVGRAEATHPVAGVGNFRVTLTRRDGEGALDVVFLLGAADAPALTAPVAQAPRPRAPAPPVEASPVEASAPDQPTEEPEPNAALTQLLARAAALGASDLHLAMGETPAIRAHGALSQLSDVGPIDLPSLMGSLLDARVTSRLEGGVSADFVISLPSNGGRPPRVRGNVYRASGGLAVAFRLLPPSAPLLEGPTAVLADLAQLPNGLVVIAGPAGSGKTTTLAALAREILERRSVVLVSLEDPIEYALASPGRSLVRQRQIGRDVRDFATGLRDALREDPDVILVGEMRDAESISLALTAAETGHLVLATLHSRSSASTVERIVDTYPEGRQQQVRVQLADSLKAVVTQRLVPRARGGGRALAIEILRVNSSVASGLREGKLGVVTSAMQSGKRDGMVMLERSLADLVRRGEISLDDAQAIANDRDSLATYLR